MNRFKPGGRPHVWADRDRGRDGPRRHTGV